jgi:23S rRNA (uracil1939-C5)-methyltransferase
MDETYEVLALNSAFGGNCVGRLPSGKAVFIPFCLPGEKVRVRISEEKTGYCKAELLDVIEASPLRIAPRCPHYGACGGCHYQHIPYAHQLEMKMDIVRDQLVRVGGLKDIPVHPIQASPQEWNYRNHIQFHLTPEGKLGFLAPDSHRVIPIRECHLPEPALNQVWPELDMEPIPGVERISLRCGADQEPLLLFESSSDETPEFDVDFALSAVFTGPNGKVVLAGSDYLTMNVADKAFHVSADAFFQVNSEQAAAMVKHLLSILPLRPDSVVADVYCGVGLFSAFIAPRVGQLIGIELGEAACEDYALNLDAFDNVALYQGAAEAVLPSLDSKVDIILFDPPRSGLDPRVVDAAARLASETIAYVSCDPVTFSRDAARLVKKGYRLEQVTPFDLFPQTYHIETISLFTRVGNGK